MIFFIPNNCCLTLDPITSSKLRWSIFLNKSASGGHPYVQNISNTPSAEPQEGCCPYLIYELIFSKDRSTSIAQPRLLQYFYNHLRPRHTGVAASTVPLFILGLRLKNDLAPLAHDEIPISRVVLDVVGGVVHPASHLIYEALMFNLAKDGLEHRNEHHLHQSGQVAHQEISNKLGNLGMAPPQLHQLADGAGLAQPFYASAHLAPSSRQEIWTWALP